MLGCAAAVVVVERQRADAFAGGRKDRIRQCRRDHRNRGFADAAPAPCARDDDGLDLRHLRQPQHPVIVEIRLLDAAVPDRDLAVKRGSERKHGRAFDLHLDGERVDDRAAVDGADHAMHAQLWPTEISITAAV